MRPMLPSAYVHVWLLVRCTLVSGSASTSPHLVSMPRDSYEALLSELQALRSAHAAQPRRLAQLDQRSFERHEHTNCDAMHGAPDIPGHGMTFIDYPNGTSPTVAADQCLDRCRRTRGCAAVVLARADVGWERPYQ